MSNSDRLTEITARHTAMGLVTANGTTATWDICRECDDVMPCDADYLLAALAAMTVRAEQAELAIREAVYDYGRGDELGCVERLRAALAAPATEGERYV